MPQLYFSYWLEILCAIDWKKITIRIFWTVPFVIKLQEIEIVMCDRRTDRQTNKRTNKRTDRREVWNSYFDYMSIFIMYEVLVTCNDFLMVFFSTWRTQMQHFWMNTYVTVFLDIWWLVYRRLWNFIVRQAKFNFKQVPLKDPMI